MTTTEAKLDQAYTYEKIFYIRIIKQLTEKPVDPVDTQKPDKDERQGTLTKDQLIREAANDSKPMPYVESLDAQGLLTLGWTKSLASTYLPGDYSTIEDGSLRVRGETRSLQQVSESSDDEDLTEVDLAVGVTLSEE